MIFKIVDVSDVIGNEINLQKSYFFLIFRLLFSISVKVLCSGWIPLNSNQTMWLVTM